MLKKDLDNEYPARDQQTTGSVAKAEETAGVLQKGRAAPNTGGERRAEEAAVAHAVPRHSGEGDGKVKDFICCVEHYSHLEHPGIVLWRIINVY